MTSAVPKPSSFSLPVALAALLTTGIGLAITAAAWRWSATPASDAFDNAWLYVNLALLATTLTLWPGIVLARSTPRPASLLWQVPTLLVPSLPAMIIAAFLSNVPVVATLPAIFLQLAMILFGLGAISWNPRISAPIIAGTLAALAFLLPLLAYFWLEFLPLAPSGFITISPALALYHAATNPASAPLWPTILYALLGLTLYLTSPRASSPAKQNP